MSGTGVIVPMMGASGDPNPGPADGSEGAPGADGEKGVG
jgi:hypothetical protein